MLQEQDISVNAMREKYLYSKLIIDSLRLGNPKLIIFIDLLLEIRLKYINYLLNQWRCESIAAYSHLYGIERDDVDYIMETFPIVKRKDEQKHGEYHTKRQILEIYDAMANSIRNGTPYQTLLDPPPADPRVAHSPREQGK